MPVVRGKWFRSAETLAEGDSSLISRQFDRAPFESLTELTMGVVVDPENEPQYVTSSASCEPEVGFVRKRCAWPGPNVTVGVSGLNDGSREEIHGFYDAPLPGQAVLLGFAGGRMGSPVVIQKYSSHIDQRPHLEGLHDLPLTTLGHDSRDVLIGSFTGSLIALRGGVPIPGEIEIRAATDVLITSKAGIVVETDSTVEITGTTGVVIGPQPRQNAVLGEDLKALLELLLDAIQAITVTCPPLGGVSSVPLNAGDFSSLAGQLNDLLSQNVKIG